jgi:hypothetical protein
VEANIVTRPLREEKVVHITDSVGVETRQDPHLLSMASLQTAARPETARLAERDQAEM